MRFSLQPAGYDYPAFFIRSLALQIRQLRQIRL
ncbi:hypothetical protein AI2884V1_0953 [Serratia marcescens]|nr:hypothetical protein AI2872V1_0953 [Serratia marcescens]CAF2646849.1 hypothetical protein AI2884V1_0953 [Serratia marcescens]CAH5096094.1 hypothetical protein AI2872V1_0953 [Serratia marcescens]CAH5136743.1 hypothetical protein AI2884V1_0953 [Serratia marcescens]